MYKLSETCQINNLDSIYLKYFGYPSKGTFVEVGAYDGETYSNTSCLADIGWSGLYIDPILEHCQMCAKRHNNNNVSTVNCSVGSVEKDVEIYIGGALSTSNTDHLKWLQNSISSKSVSKQYKLENILSKFRINVGFDILVVDVEGNEDDVFNSFDLNFWNPKMIIIELVDDHPEFSKFDISNIHKKLRMKIRNSNYIEVYKDHINTIFVNSLWE